MTTKKKADQPERLRRLLMRAARARMVGGRVTQNENSSWNTSPFTIMNPIDPNSTWRRLNLDAETLSKIDPVKLMELLADLSPEVSKGLWDFLRMANPGYDVHCYSESGSVDENAEALVNAFIDKLRWLYGSANVVFNRLFHGAWQRGAIMGELVLDKAGRLPVDLATPDPAEFRFKEVNDPVRGQVWHLCQWQDGKLIDLDGVQTIRYIPVDPAPGKPYGRPIAQAAIFGAVFMLGLLHDLRRVVSQQGYPRLDIAYDPEEIKATLSEDLTPDMDEYWEELEEAVDQIQKVYNQLQPDQSYIHPDYITVNRPVGAVNAEGLGAVGMLIESMERILTRATKTMPLQQAITDSVSEANANRQWEIQAAGIKSIQHFVENAIEHWLTLALQVQGVVSKVEFRFAELRASEEMRDEQTRALKIKNEIEIRNQGWQTQDDASVAVTGTEAVEEAPSFNAPVEKSDEEEIEADAGADRAALLKEVRRLRALIEPFVEVQSELSVSG